MMPVEKRARVNMQICQDRAAGFRKHVALRKEHDEKIAAKEEKLNSLPAAIAMTMRDELEQMCYRRDIFELRYSNKQSARINEPQVKIPSHWSKYVECRTEIGLAGHEAKYDHFKVACEQNYTVCGTSGSKMKGLDCATVLPHTTDTQPGKLCKLNAVPSPCSNLTKYLECLVIKKNETGYGPQMPYAEMYKKQCDVEEPHPCPNTTVEFKVTNTTMTTPFALFNFSSDPENATEETENVLSIAHRAL
ncbi:hypothetical protein DdX_21871 [Ditylenchus destructor]|uniref:Uncharacterized protein n=1 Tax=Ditylenchus destructor TaxID=166010 RepID=A0AAD4MID2_9BILA|nr:hypothetical protein DdX_21871 [Ditylenchus destructor]